MSADLERLTAEFEGFQARIRQAEARFSGVGQMQEQLAELEVVAISPDRSVRVVAGAGGAVKDIQLTPDALRQAAPTLAAAIMTTLREAVAEAVRRQVAIVDETVGGELGANTSEHVRQAQAEAWAAGAGTATQYQPSQPRAARSDDDDFSHDSIYGSRG
ncbi:YbaB/EbfC family nucleoid-associated protein [Actinokineospora auranticolor]|uniref:DNA-binding protein YbaB n=1 Tax=Actinokineospora auranticolor TaxID=155976 RepID=A0A2S6GB76_9PSEU|nr:YbaB/EbfC family nucleoid-associated protein [Actinokineospora auranticolor]PPK60748.1 DNA-binding protein YbaB [Actinokineospora auranticolor]